MLHQLLSYSCCSLFNMKYFWYEKLRYAVPSKKPDVYICCSKKQNSAPSTSQSCASSPAQTIARAFTTRDSRLPLPSIQHDSDQYDMAKDPSGPAKCSDTSTTLNDNTIYEPLKLPVTSSAIAENENYIIIIGE